MLHGKLLIGLAVLLFFGNFHRAWASEGASVTKEQAYAIVTSRKFVPVKSRSEIPKVWWKECRLEEMSDINGPFSAGCTGPAPHERLMAASVSEPFATVLSESGGYAHYSIFKLFKRDGNVVQAIYTENLSVKDIPEFRKKLGI